MKKGEHIQLEGRLGAEPEICILKSGHKLARFPLAVKHLYRNTTGELITDVEWHDVVAWGNLAALAERELHKGMTILVDGIRPRARSTNFKGRMDALADVVASELFIHPTFSH
jgi:single-strand DNA-binding protein